jgi:hypothetical protein
MWPKGCDEDEIEVLKRTVRLEFDIDDDEPFSGGEFDPPFVPDVRERAVRCRSDEKYVS